MISHSLLITNSSSLLFNYHHFCVEISRFTFLLGSLKSRQLEGILKKNLKDTDLRKSVLFWGCFKTELESNEGLLVPREAGAEIAILKAGKHWHYQIWSSCGQTYQFAVLDVKSVVSHMLMITCIYDEDIVLRYVIFMGKRA